MTLAVQVLCTALQETGGNSIAGTILQQDSLDLLAEFMGRGEEVENLTNQAMDGTMNLSTVSRPPLLLARNLLSACALFTDSCKSADL